MAIISCPKCHFTQPEDQYCAKCGIDMRSYQAPKQGYSRQIAIFVPIVIFTLMALGGGFWYIKKKKSEQNKDQIIATQMKYLRQNSQERILRSSQQTLTAENTNNSGSSPTVSSSSSSSSSSSENSSPRDARSENEANTPVLGSGPNSNSPNNSSSGGGAALNSSGSKTSGLATDHSVYITFTETDTSFLENEIIDKIHNASGSAGGSSGYESYGDYRAGVIDNFDAVIDQGENSGQIRALDRISMPLKDLKENQKWFKGFVEESTQYEIGFTLHLQFQSLERWPLLGQFEIMNAIRLEKDQTSPPSSQTTQSNFEINSQNGFFMALSLPPNLHIPEDQKRYYRPSILRIYLSPSIAKGSTVFVVFLRVK